MVYGLQQPTLYDITETTVTTPQAQYTVFFQRDPYTGW